MEPRPQIVHKYKLVKNKKTPYKIDLFFYLLYKVFLQSIISYAVFDTLNSPNTVYISFLLAFATAVTIP